MEVLVKYLLYQSSALSSKCGMNAGKTNLEGNSEQDVHMSTKPKLAPPNVFCILNDPKYKSEWTK